MLNFLSTRRSGVWTAALLAAVVVWAAPVRAQLIAYEGFDVSGASDADPLAGLSIGASSVGFVDTWTVSASGNGGASAFRSTGLDYPASYPGSHTAIGGHGQVTGATGANAFLRLNLDAAAAATVNSSSEVFISFLAERVGTTVTDAGLLDAATRTANNLASEYPRNAGARIMNNATPNNNSALGTIGKASDWNSNGVMFGDPAPVLVDTWGAAQFNDVNNLYTGADFADGVDHLVLSVNTSTSTYRLQVNPQADGSNDGEVTWVHTNNGVPRLFEMYGFGVEAGNDSNNRPVGDMVFDEIYVATTFEGAAGFRQVPEPASAAGLATALVLGLGALRRRR